MEEERAERFVGDDKSIISPQCNKCAHYKKDMTCAAFVEIPMLIFSNQFDHKKQFTGDNGIQFEAIDE